MNFRGLYEELLCSVCNEEFESQKHIYDECKKMDHNEKEKIEYEKIENGNVFEMLKVARKFKRNLEIREKT